MNEVSERESNKHWIISIIYGIQIYHGIQRKDNIEIQSRDNRVNGQENHLL